MIGLGAYQTAIPPGCWNNPGFRDCANLTWAFAQKVCEDRGSPGDDCAGPLYDTGVMATCPCSPTLAPSAKAAAAAEATAPGFDWKPVALIGLAGALAYVFMSKGKS